MSAPKISIGSLRHRIMIQQATETIADDGSTVQSWSNYKPTRAEIVPLNSSEAYVAQGITASVIHRITCRYVAGVVPKMRIKWGERIFEIEGVRDIDERGRFLIMNCEEQV
jgi:SPP1 family predicted phage head-tail adaptor